MSILNLSGVRVFVFLVASEDCSYICSRDLGYFRMSSLEVSQSENDNIRRHCYTNLMVGICHGLQYFIFVWPMFHLFRIRTLTRLRRELCDASVAIVFIARIIARVCVDLESNTT